MSDRSHHYRAEIVWTGNRGEGTSSYRAYARDHEVRVDGKTTAGPGVLPGSSDRTFHGDPSRWNPEELLVSALGQCHLLAYLHLCAVNAVVVTDYTDEVTGTMITTPDGGGHFVGATLHPRVVITADSDPDTARALHDDAHRLCFIASSVNFEVTHEPVIVVRT